MSKFIYQLVIENLPTDAQSLSKLKSFLLLELEFSVEEAAEILNSIPVAVAQSDSEEKLEQIMLSLKQINVISSIKKTLTETCETEEEELFFFDDDIPDDDVEKTKVLTLDDESSLEHILEKFSDELFADKELENLDTPLQVEGNFELEPDDSRSFEIDSTGGEESEFTSHRFAEESEDLSSMTKTFEKTDGNFFQLENDPLEDDLTAAFSEENIAKVQTEKSLENLVSVDLGASKILGNTLDESNFFGEIANHLLPQDSIKDPVGKLEPTTREVANDATEVIQPLKKRDNLSNFNSIVALSQPKQERVESTSLSVLILAVMAALLGVINLYLFIGAQLNEETLPKVVVSVDSESKDTTSKPSRQKKKNGMEISEAKFELANSEAVVAFSIKKIAKKSLLFEMSLKDYPLTDNERKFENVQTGTNLTWIENLSSAVVVDLPKNVMDELNFSTSGRLMIKDPRILRRLLATVSVSFIDKTLRLNVTSDTFTTHRVFNLSDSDWEKIIQLLK